MLIVMDMVEVMNLVEDDQYRIDMFTQTSAATQALETVALALPERTLPE